MRHPPLISSSRLLLCSLFVALLSLPCLVIAQIVGDSGDQPDEGCQRDLSGILRAYPPGSLAPEALENEARPLFEADGDRDRSRRAPESYANVRPPYAPSGERYDSRALLEAACRQDAFDAARRGSSLEDQRLRLYKREYRDCIQRYEKRR